MNWLTQFIFITVCLMYQAPALAMLNISTGVDVCQIFAADDSEGDKKKDKDKKEDGEEEEEEPDCD